MTSLYILIPLSVALVFLIGMIFWWSVRSGQFDDLEGPAYRMLLDDRDPDTSGHDKPDTSAARVDGAEAGGVHENPDSRAPAGSAHQDENSKG